MHRRQFIHTAIGGALAAPLLGALPRRATAEIALGQATLTTVSDGNLVLPGSFLIGDLPMSEVQPVLDAYDLSTEQITPPCNLALYRDGERNVLFDVGSGPDFMPSAGAIVDSLDAVGLAPEDITHVVFTHAHPDHIWGLLDEFDEPLFYEATYMMGRDEWDYWWNPNTVDEIGEARAAFAVGAKRRMEVIEDQVELFGAGQEVLPGIAAYASPGHTPGHMSFEVGIGSARAMVVGDAIGNHHLAFARPDLHSGADQDPIQGAAVRMRLFEKIMAEDLHVVGFHLPNGGIGRVDRDGEFYRFVPEA